MTRREFAGVSLAAATTAAAPRLAAQQEETLRSAYLADLTVQIDPAHDAGAGRGGRMIVPVAGGTIDGPRLKGQFIRPSGDWMDVRADGSKVLDVRLLIETDDKEFVYLSWRGVAWTPTNGTLIARITPVFETGAAKYGWLNNVVAVGVLRPIPGKIAYRLYEIL